jgi:hypothetical protein
MTEENSVRNRVFEVVATHLGWPPTSSTKSRASRRTWAPTPRCDRARHGVRRRVDIDVPDDDSEKVVTVGDAVNLIERLLAKPQD